MEKRFSKEDVLRYLYREMDPGEQEAFLNALTEDEELWEEFETLSEAHEDLKDTELNASETSLAKIRKQASQS